MIILIVINYCISNFNYFLNSRIKGIPSVTSIAFEDGLTMGVGTTNGLILLYDIRSSKPITIKDHLYGLPILDMAFHPNQNLVISQDPKIVKIWDKHTVIKTLNYLIIIIIILFI